MLRTLKFVALASAVIGTFLATAEFSAFKFSQHDYHVVHERLEVFRYDKSYVKYSSTANYKYNRTCAAANLTACLNVDLGNNVQIIVQAYKFMSNEYRLFPVHFQINLCDGFQKNVLGIRDSCKRCGNFTGCPLMKDVWYHFCQYTPDESMLPPHVPSGRYLVELNATYFGKEVWVGRLYGAVTRPEVKGF